MDIKAAVMKLLEESGKPLKRKHIQRHLKADATKKEVKKALRSLVKTDEIAKEGKKAYRINAKAKEDSNSSDSESDDEKDDRQPLPIAEQLRRKKAPTSSTKSPLQENPKNNEKVEDDHVSDIDEEIRRLEEELKNDNDSDSEEDSDEESEASEREPTDDAGGVISLSTLAEDRISALPTSCLPSNKRRKLKGIDGDNSAGKTISNGERKSNKRKRDDSQKSTTEISAGLKAAVKVVLNGYVARSNEKIPFYCRVCAKQYADSDEFFQHKRTEFHKAAVEMEKKASYCKLCRKQLTSPVQLQEHLHSKPHKDRLQMMKNRQPQRQRK
ncbi:Zinc-finger double-stranded RNA-binding [Seminavis robusta]|uniref:Zinc-finger double-stranded RNA-binding n=1 Tax=Seminavis robusta TaxID=568900 RepID=A0A9N8EFN6_9STRA|nr:Zinc-finger double-stranded RNA-binding [Seminavis robusta]|eukprot:Sro922_g220480.1 Zinc-finger double-stranded RNA-binding (327) ;mRNA; f:7631-8611